MQRRANFRRPLLSFERSSRKTAYPGFRAYLFRPIVGVAVVVFLVFDALLVTALIHRDDSPRGSVVQLPGEVEAGQSADSTGSAKGEGDLTARIAPALRQGGQPDQRRRRTEPESRAGPVICGRLQLGVNRSAYTEFHEHGLRIVELGRIDHRRRIDVGWGVRRRIERRGLGRIGVRIGLRVGIGLRFGIGVRCRWGWVGLKRWRVGLKRWRVGHGRWRVGHGRWRIGLGRWRPRRRRALEHQEERQARSARYHSTVRRNPSSMSTRGDQPRSSRAFEPSTALLGCPSGFDWIPGESSLEPCDLRDELGKVSDRDLRCRTKVHGLPALQSLQAEDDALGRVVDVEELPGRPPRAPQDDLVVTALIHRFDGTS